MAKKRSNRNCDNDHFISNNEQRVEQCNRAINDGIAVFRKCNRLHQNT